MPCRVVKHIESFAVVNYHTLVDARGKKKKKNAKDDLREFYEIEEENEVDSVAASSSQVKPNKNSDKSQSMETRLEYLNKLARGEISEASESDSEQPSASSDSDSDSSDAASVSSETSYDPLHIPGDEPLMENVDNVKRLSIQNCDWDNVRAVDLL